MQREYTANTEHTQAAISSDDSWMDRIQVTEGTLTKSQDRALTHQRGIELQTNPPKSSKDTFVLGIGRRKYLPVQDKSDPHWSSKMTVLKDSSYQVPTAFEPWIGTLDDLAAWISDNSGPGAKEDCRTLYAGVPLVPGQSPKKGNIAFCQVIILDLDAGALRGPEDVERIRGLIQSRGWAALMYSTATSRRERPKMRMILPTDVSLSYDEHRIVAREILAKVQAEIGTTEGWDPMSCVATLPMSVPRWGYGEEARIREEEAWRPEVIHGEAIKVSERIEDVRELVREAKLEEEARLAAYAAAGRSADLISADERIQDAVDLMEEEGLVGLEHGHGRTDQGAFLAAAICASFGLDAEQIEATLSRTSPGIDRKILSHKAEEAARVVGPWRLMRLASQKGASQDSYALSNRSPQFELVEDIVAGTHLNCIKSVPATSEGPATPGETPVRLVPIPGVGDLLVHDIHERKLPYLKDFSQLPAKITVLRSLHGTGKNWSLRPAWARLKQEGGRGALLSHRTFLTHTGAEDAGIANYQDCPQGEPITCPVAITLDSFPRIAEYKEDEDGFLVAAPQDIIVGDEWMQVIRHLYSDTMRKEGRTRPAALALRRQFREAKKVLLQDADMDGLGIRMFQLISGQKINPEEIHITNNTWTPEAYEVDLYEGKNGKIAFLQELWNAADAGGQHYISCSSAEEAKARAEEARQRYPEEKILLITSDNSGDPEIIDGLKRGGAWIANFRMVFTSPAVGSGVSLYAEELKGFRRWGLCNSGDGPGADDVGQFLRRIRHDNGPIKVYVGAQSNYRQGETCAAKLLQDLTALSLRNIRVLDEELSDLAIRTGDFVDPNGVRRISVDDGWLLQGYAEILAHTARKSHLHRYPNGDPGEVEKSLKASGAKIRIISCPEATPEEIAEAKAALAGAKEAVKEKAIMKELSAEDITDEEREELGRLPRTEEITAKISRHDDQKFYGVALTRELLCRDKNGRRKKEIRRLQHVRALQAGHDKKIKALDARAIRGKKDGMPSILGCESLYLKARLRTRLLKMWGATDILEAAQEGLVLTFPQGEIPKEVRAELQRILGMTAGPNLTWATLARSIFAQMGLKTASKSVRKGDKVVRELRIQLEPLEEVLDDGQAYWDRLIGEGKTSLEPVSFSDEEMIEALLD